jgi:hypothetical protein
MNNASVLVVVMSCWCTLLGQKAERRCDELKMREEQETAISTVSAVWTTMCRDVDPYYAVDKQAGMSA